MLGQDRIYTLQSLIYVADLNDIWFDLYRVHTDKDVSLAIYITRESWSLDEMYIMQVPYYPSVLFSITKWLTLISLAVDHFRSALLLLSAAVKASSLRDTILEELLSAVRSLEDCACACTQRVATDTNNTNFKMLFLKGTKVFIVFNLGFKIISTGSFELVLRLLWKPT